MKSPRPVPFARAKGLLSLVVAFGFAAPFSATLHSAAPTPLDWPAFDRTTRPWTRWWWLGSAVDKQDLGRLLDQFHKAGIGGVEICPIYGAMGAENRFIPFLTPKWMDMLAFTTEHARTLDMGVDMTTGTGWPMGGPWIPADQASENARLVPPATPGQPYTLALKQGIQRVKRAAPGGEGWVLDPFSTHALDTFLSRFDQAFQGFHAPAPRAQFHDSFEYYGANWTPDFLTEFQQRRGYDLKPLLGALAGQGDPDTAARVREDYRRTLGELHLAWVSHWTAWSHTHGSLSRDQAHGAPANIEDVYAAADIPETEGSFGGVTANEMPMLKFASSAAHVTGKRLASSETFTWLGEHFQVPLASLKPAADTFYLAGINHIFFHGIPYSPEDVAWPGWLFYASVNLGPEGGIWHDLPAFNAYATRVQSILQGGKPDNDVLLYFPVSDFWPQAGPLPGANRAKPEGGADPLVFQFTTPGHWMEGTPFHNDALALARDGYSYDEVTDALLAGASAKPGACLLGGNSYQAIVVPHGRFIPVETFERLVALAKGGATVVFEGGPAEDVPGLHDFEARRARLRALVANLALKPGRNAIGSGCIWVGSDLGALLRDAGLQREAMVDLGLHAVRRARPDGTDYFIVNTGNTAVEAWVPLARPAAYASLLDPLGLQPAGSAALRQSASGTEVFLQLAPKGSLVLREYGSDAASAFAKLPAWQYLKAEPAKAVALSGTWSVHFLEGGPVLPKDFSATSPTPWTARGDADADRFSGTARYTLTFDFQPGSGSDWLLSLGTVAESARMRLNGAEVATLWCPPFELPVGRLLKAGRNVLEIDITNVAANRIRDLDRRGVQWKRFHEINFVNRDYRPFDASGWPVRTSGLVGPVTLVPATDLAPSSR